MSDVTFGVKVTEEMKNELSELMKINDLSGKEFMHLLLTTYKIEQAKQENALFESDMSELQILLQRIQNIYLNISDKTKVLLCENTKLYEEERKSQLEKSTLLKEEIAALKDEIQNKEAKIKEYIEVIESITHENKKAVQQLDDLKEQSKNYTLLHTKFEQEIIHLKSEVENYKRLEIEIEERTEENNVLKNRNDDLASEVWFLKREMEKLNLEKEQLVTTHQLELKNNLLEQKLFFSEKIENLKAENIALEREFNNKLKVLYERNQNNVEKIL